MQDRGGAGRAAGHGRNATPHGRIGNRSKFRSPFASTTTPPATFFTEPERAQPVLEQSPAGNAKVRFGDPAAEARGLARGGDHEPDAFGHRQVSACSGPACEAGPAGSPSAALWVASTT